jgi:hypothetical protein
MRMRLTRMRMRLMRRLLASKGHHGQPSSSRAALITPSSAQPSSAHLLAGESVRLRPRQLHHQEERRKAPLEGTLPAFRPFPYG